MRAEAAAAGMAAATARESQDVCFLGGGALDDFLAELQEVDDRDTIFDLLFDLGELFDGCLGKLM